MIFAQPNLRWIPQNVNWKMKDAEKEKRFYEWFGVWGVSRLKQACLSYNGKVLQLFDLNRLLKQDVIMIVDYDSSCVQEMPIRWSDL